MTITHRSRSDEGFGLVEIVVAMLMLAVLAIALLPLLIQGLKVSAANATMATATQLMDGALDAAGSITGCGAVPTNSTAATDSRGVALTLSRSHGACPGAYPGTVTFTVTVTRDDTSAVVATATTQLYVTGG